MCWEYTSVVPEVFADRDTNTASRDEQVLNSR